MKKILITGAGSYIGTSFETYMKQYENYKIDTLNMKDLNWKNYDFSSYDVVFHVAGIAHADVGHVTEETKKLYYKINTDLTIETAKKAKESKVKQFIYMSSMIVYSGCGETHITKNTKPKAANFYGDSKLQADLLLQELNSDGFKVVILRPPMIYGKGSKGNYLELAKLASILPIFPIVKNQRSMLHVDNLCEFVKLMVDNNETGIFFPQNSEYTNTSAMVELIAKIKGHKIIMIPGTNILVNIMKKLPGSIGARATKAFGDSVYEMSMSEYKDNYRVNSLRKSLELTEG